jgi:formate dehydrogenase iron-sulfur subunit
MSLPLMNRATEDGVMFLLTPRAPAHTPVEARRSSTDVVQDRMPARPPGPGEQYRFHVDMGSCIGCKCCVVACNEQNGNPADLNWRRVAEIEGGSYPDVQRSFLSMGCNHCLEPTCLAGCPVDAYTKEPDTGIVRHSADTCIGCQYCTWNCSYGVPQYNPERGVVGKCDMCHGRLGLGQAPACVSACPEGAIAIEIVNIAAWRAEYAAASAATGIPVSDDSLSTTRLTMPAGLPTRARAVDLTHVTPADPHWPLVVMTVLTQFSVGAFATIWIAEMLGASTRLGVAAITSLLVGGLALGASTLHLGRPIHAYRALKMWRRSWLSREVLFFSGFSGVASLYAGILWLDLPGGAPAGAATVLLGIAGVVASACIYRVPARPAWNSSLTVLQFLMTGTLLGLLFAAAVGVGDAAWVRPAVVTAAVAEIVLIASGFLRLSGADTVELRGTARLLSTTLAIPFVLRGVLLAAGGVVLPLVGGAWPVLGAALALAMGGELAGRYLFFVSVVPKHMTTPYVAMGSEAA